MVEKYADQHVLESVVMESMPNGRTDDIYVEPSLQAFGVLWRHSGNDPVVL